MREIKFRGKDELGQWNYGNLVRYTEDDGEQVTCIVSTARSEISAELVFVPVDEKTVGQFTGLRDMNGKCIYEGDVVKRHSSAYGLDDIGVVRYDDEEAMFVLRCEKRHYTNNLPFLKHETFNDGHCSIDETYTYEVIGNIYDDQISMEDLI